MKPEHIAAIEAATREYMAAERNCADVGDTNAVIEQTQALMQLRAACLEAFPDDEPQNTPKPDGYCGRHHTYHCSFCMSYYDNDYYGSISAESEQPTAEAHPHAELEKDIEHVININSAENVSDTPDFILAQALCACLDALNKAIQQRETFYGRNSCPSEETHRKPDTITVNLSRESLKVILHCLANESSLDDHLEQARASIRASLTGEVHDDE